MTPLETQFTFRGDTFAQLKRADKLALFERTKDGRTRGYEVVRIKDVPEATWPNGKVTPAHEGYPGDNDFGKTAWYFMAVDLDGAEKRFRTESRGKG